MPVMKKLIFLVSFLAAGCGGSGPDSDAGGPRGVTDDTIVIGSHNDLSGVLAIWGVPYTNGVRMRFDELNAAGGVHGRRIEFIVEDTQYQMPMAVKATNKLLNVDDIFLMLGAMGTPMNLALMPKMFEADVPSLFPLTGSEAMYAPFHPMKFQFIASYGDQVRAGMRYMAKTRDFSKVCVQALANDYGEENVRGFEQAAEELGLEIVYTGRHKATETDFAGTITAIKNSGCELLVLAPLVKDTILIYSAAREAGWDAPIVSNMVSYVDEVADTANGATEGLYSSAPILLPHFDTVEPDSWLGKWHRSYLDRYGEEPAPQAIVGYLAADLVIQALEIAGRDVTLEKVLAGIESIDDYEDPFGGPPISFGPNKHQGANYLNFYQVRDGRWQTVEQHIPF
jgi:branched-chain amino acid transport system substrate-binding protein